MIVLISLKNDIDFIWNSKFPINSLYLMRGYLAIDEKVKKNFFNRCFDAYWKENIDISLEKNVINILNSCGLNKNVYFEDIKKQEIKDKLKNYTNNAFQKDIFGAPTFVVNNKIFWGQDRLEYALDEYNL